MARAAPASTLALSVSMSASRLWAFRMFFGIGRDRDFDIGIALLDALDQVRRTLIAVGMRLIGGADAGGGIAAQRHDVADADVVIARHHVVDLAFGGADAGQMCGRGQPGLFQDAGDGRVGALSGRSPGAIGHRDEIGGERRQPVDGLPKGALHLLGLGRKELEGDFGRMQFALPVRCGRGRLGHGSHGAPRDWADVRSSGRALK